MPCLLRRENHIETVKECLDSIKRYSNDYELIIVDDGSPLDTKFLRDNADLYVRHKKPMGIAYGWNHGIKISSGFYKVIINDDIVAQPNWIECMIEAFKIKGTLVTAPAVENMPVGLKIEENRTWFPGSCFMLNENTIEKIGYFDEQFVPFNYEDIDYWTRVYNAGYKLSRNYRVQVLHKEGHVIHAIENNGEIDQSNRVKYINKWGFDPIPVLYHGTEKFPWEKK